MHNAIVALQQDRERQQQEQIQRRRGRRRRQGSCWVSDWLLHGKRLRHSHYYNLMESFREKDPGSEFLAVCFDQTATFFLLAFLLWHLLVTSVSETASLETGSVCWGGGWCDFHLPLPLPPPFLPHFVIMLDVYTTRCLLGKFWRIMTKRKYGQALVMIYF